MGEDQCNGPSSERCEESHCWSGVTDDSVCDHEVPIVCPLGQTADEGLVFDDYKIHWFCYDSILGNVDVYKEKEALGGTICRTDHK